MNPRRYAIIDIETTGLKAPRDKITEIAIVLHDGERVLDEWSTLINPEVPIPYGITELTGITNDMLADAPRFYEVAREIVERTEGAIFVAHNVRFDYSFVREEFRRLGYTYTRKQLCTVRLARQAFPGLPSYSLDSLIRHLRIPVENRHRALGDARATALLFEQILERQRGSAAAKKFINLGLRESKLPPGFSIKKIESLPEACGVYYFHDATGEVVYVGKSKNIRKRVVQHFANMEAKGGRMQRYVRDISYELTGNELIALLLESDEIKRLRPRLNRSQRSRHFPWGLVQWRDEQGYLHLDVEKLTNQPCREARADFRILSEYPKVYRAKARLQQVVRDFELCARLTHLDEGEGPCFDYHLKRCHGACIGAEGPESYNARVRAAEEVLKTVFDRDFVLLDRGRHAGEHSIVLVEDGRYVGFAFVEADELPHDIEALRELVRPRRSNPETNRIIQRYLADPPASVRVIHLDRAAG